MEGPVLDEAGTEEPVNGVPRRIAMAWWALAVLIAAHFTVAYVHGTNFYVPLGAYMHGQARLPFQYRALTGWALRAITSLWPAGGSGSNRHADLALMALIFASVLWIFASARSAAARLVGQGGPALLASLGVAVPLYVMYAAPAYDFRFSYPYDVPSLALSFATFAAFLAGRAWLLLLLFALACLSRETALLLIGVIALWPAPAPYIRRALLLAALCAIWAASYAWVHLLYAGNVRESAFMGQIAAPGGTVIELGNNWQDLRDPLSWPALLSIFAWLWLPVALFWPRLTHPGLRRAILVLTPIWVLLMFTVGRLREVRVFAELTMVYWAAVVWIWQAPERKDVFFSVEKNQKTFP